MGKALVPFVFVFSPSLLLVIEGFSWSEFVLAAAGAMLGIWALSAAFSRWLFAPLHRYEQGAAGGGGDVPGGARPCGDADRAGPDRAGPGPAGAADARPRPRAVSGPPASAPPARAIDVVAPNLKRRLSGVTATIVRLVPVQNRRFGVWATGPGLPAEVPHIPLRRAATLPADRPRVWHARRNTEMVLGLLLRHVLRRRYRLLFTSAAQRRHTGFTRWLIRQMDAVVATSAQAASYLEVPARVVMHGVDTDTFRPAPDRAALAAELGLAPGTWVGCFGRIRPQKGTDLLVRAMLPLMRDRPEVRLLLVGRPDDAAFLDRLREEVAAAGLADRVRLAENLPWDALVRHYAAMDVYVAPQRWEGFGLTPLEAMASGVPVVATTVGAFPDLVVEGETGHLVPPEDAAALGARIASLLDDPAGRAAMGRAARAHVEAHHRIEHEAEALIAIYRELLGR